MSPSWTERWLRPSATLGVVLGSTEIISAGPDAVAPHREAMPLALFRGRADAQACDMLTHALLRATAPWRTRHLRVQVVLPDPLGNFMRWSLDDMPRARRLRETLVRWQFAQALRLNAEQLEVRWEARRRSNGRIEVLAQAADAEWLACVRRALQAARLVASTLNVAAVYRVNHMLRAQRPQGEACALVALDRESWSVLLCDENAHPASGYATWRLEGESSPAHWNTVCDELERAVISDLVGTPERRVSRFCLAGTDPLLEEFKAVLDSRLLVPSVVLPASPRCAAVPAMAALRRASA